jgi:hypothetical protein
MANVTIAGNSYCVASDIAMADWRKVAKYRPQAMTLTDEETKEAYFKVALGTSSLSDYGISFGGVSNDEEKVATCTLPIPTTETDAKEYVLDKAGVALSNLRKIEENISAVLGEIQEERDTLSESIMVSV